MTKIFCQILVLILCCKIVTAQLIINEIMASNSSVMFVNGETPDWVEIFNSGNIDIDLNEYFLSNNIDSLGKWRFPKFVLSPGNYIVIYADSKPFAGEWHTNFKLSAKNDHVYLSKYGNVICDEIIYQNQFADISFGRYPDGSSTFIFMENSTPGTQNKDGYKGILSPIRFSQTRGFYSTPFTLILLSEQSDATIFYTLDGSVPNVFENSTSKKYVNPIEIDGTSFVRAIQVKPGYKTSEVVTHSYIYLEDVINQSSHPKGFPLNWGHSGYGDYQMDPEIVKSPDYCDKIIEDMKDIPTLSMVMAQDDWFGKKGIYQHGELDERAVSAELFNTNRSFDVNCGVMVVGGTSVNRWKSDKLSFRLKFKTEYGPGKLDVPLFGEENASSFNTLVVDARSNNCWFYGGSWDIERSPLTQRDIAQYTRDQFAADIQNAMGGYAPHGFYVHLYLNGLYWGIYNLHERPDECFAADYLGGNDEDYNILKHEFTEIINGSNRDYLALFNLMKSAGDIDSIYNEIDKRLDINAFINYMLMNYFLGNRDWDNHNWYASFNPNEENGKWRFHSWDVEHIMESIGFDAVKNLNKNAPTELHQLLMQSKTYKEEFENAVEKQLFNNGVLTAKNLAKYYQMRADNVDRAVVGESARWGDNRLNKPLTRDEEWVTEREWILNEFFPNRRQSVMEQFRQKGWISDLEPPKVIIDREEMHSATYRSGQLLELQAKQGEIYFTLNGSDPRNQFNLVDSAAQKYMKPIQLVIDTFTIKARTLRQGSWSALCTVCLYPQNRLFVDEIYYHPINQGALKQSDLEYISLKNFGSEVIDLTGASFTKGIDFIFKSNSILNPGERLILASNANQYESFFENTPFDQYNGSLDNSGEKIILQNIKGDTLINFNYSDSYPWPEKADGKGYALALDSGQVNADLNDPINWHLLKIQQPTNIVNNYLRNTPFNKLSLFCFPNPVRDEANIVFELVNDSFIELAIYNLQGQRIIILESGFRKSGKYSTQLNISKYHQFFEPGVYICSLSSELSTTKYKILIR